jgi:hypothetical protein
MINPYEFLGVTFQDSLATVKGRYYELSRLCHPDKGGNADDMLALQSAYMFVKHELEYAKEQSTSVPVQELEALYESFKQTSLVNSARIPNYHDVVADMIGFSFDAFKENCKKGIKGEEITDPSVWQAIYYAILSLIVPKIEASIPEEFKGDALWSYVREQFDFLLNELMTPADMMYASIPHGYDNDNAVDLSTTSENKNIIVYNSTDASQFNIHDGQHSNMYRSLDDYSIYENQLFDYALAHQSKNIQKIEEDANDVKLSPPDLNSYVQIRSNMDIELDKVLKNKGVILL